jgi:beta-1,4-mannosyltransferase
MSRVAVVVLGDLGRSPRMQYHALALAAAGHEVDLVGYRGTPPDPAVAGDPRIRVHPLPAPWRHRAPRWLAPAATAADVAAQLAMLVGILARARPDTILVQTPPAIPTLPAARLAARAAGARLVVDWHNFGGDMLALRLGRGHPAVRIAEAVEGRAGAGADAHLCVSEAMRVELARRFGVAATVFRDRPARRVARPADRTTTLARLGVEVPAGARVVVTSSSWTLDEDFGLLLEALARCEATLRAEPGRPPLAFLVTGAGPLRAAWEREVAARAFSRVTVRALWLSADDYPLLLAAADLGVSLHRSASGFDLPMKIADMYGAGLPVCALDYGPVLGEMVRAGETGLLFRDAAGLADLLCDPGDARLHRLRQEVAREAAVGWRQGWNLEAAPVLCPTRQRSQSGAPEGCATPPDVLIPGSSQGAWEWI